MDDSGYILVNRFPINTFGLAEGGTLRPWGNNASTWSTGQGLFGIQMENHTNRRLFDLENSLPELDLVGGGKYQSTAGGAEDARYFQYPDVGKVYLKVRLKAEYVGDTKFGQPQSETLGYFQFFQGPVSGRLRLINFEQSYFESDLGEADGYRLKLLTPASGYELRAEGRRPMQDMVFSSFIGFSPESV